MGEPTTLRVALFASGRGSNFQALLNAHAKGQLQGPHIELLPALLIVNRQEAGAVELARAAGIPVSVIPDPGLDPDSLAQAQLACLRAHQIDRIALVGYLRKIPASIIAAYRDAILNIHPGPLPQFGGPKMYGRHVHQAVLDAKVSHSGPTVHRVDEVYDRGPVIAHQPVPVRPGDDATSLAARVLAVEHELLARALRWDWAKDERALDPHQRAGLSKQD